MIKDIGIKKVLCQFTECFQNDMILPGYGVIKKENVSNAEECQKMFCQQHKQCTAFEYNIDTNICILKKPPIKFLGILQLKKAKRNVFGPKYCPGICSYLIHSSS